jgi:hypothetical protein
MREKNWGKMGYVRFYGKKSHVPNTEKFISTVEIKKER